MIIHTKLDHAAINRAALGAGGAYLVKCEEHGSRTHERAFNVLLRGTSNRRPSFGDGSADYAATWDEWGVFFATVFEADPDARMGGTKNPTYADRQDFDRKTFYRFDGSIMPMDAHGDHTFRYEGTPYEQECTKCSARFTWRTA